jgi:hydrophobic/amphiphilic exporter-1 (mainly G- bacteria), HAE1 family
MGLTRLAISRPVFMLMLMVATMLIGFLSYQSMRVEQNPEVSFGVLTITTVYPGAGPEEINTLISRRVEEAVSGVGGIREITSTAQEGVSNVVANFELGTDMDAALNDTRAKIDAIVGQLPRGIERPIINKLDSASDPVMNLVVRSDTMNNKELRDLADRVLKDRFASIPGVAAVLVGGGEIREIQVRIRKDRLLAYGVGISTLQRAIAGASQTVPSGRIVAGGEETLVRVLGEFQTVEELQNMELEIQDPNNQGAKGMVVRLRDIADVVDTAQERDSFARLNGTDAVTMTIQKAREGNAVEISHAADGIIAGINQDFGIQMVKTLDQATFIEESLHDLTFALFFGIFLVALIVFLFLHDIRGTIIVAIAIPLCIFGTFIVMRLFGFTINNMSMLALSLAIGVLVDDAIVVLENIYRHLKLGEEPVTAAINGRSEIGLAAIAITLADVVVFLPIAFMGGITGQFFRQLGLGFAICVLISLFVSFTITPMLASRWYRRGEDIEHPKSRFAQIWERGFEGLQSAYVRALQWSLANRWFVFITGFTILISVFMMIGGSFAPSAQAAAGVGMGLFMIAIVLGIVFFIVNWLRGYVRPTIALGGVLFGLVFPLAAVLGFAWASWKGEPIFKFAFFPPSDGGRVAVSIELPPGASLDSTLKVVQHVENIVMQHPDVKYTVSNVGSQSGDWTGGSRGSNRGQVSVTLNDKKAIMDTIAFWNKHEGELRTRSDTAVAADILEMVGRYPGASIKVAATNSFGFGAPIQMALVGDDRQQLVEAADNIRVGLQNGSVAGIINPDITSKPGRPELQAIPDRVRLADAGLTVAELGQAMRMLYEGDNSTKFRSDGQEYDIRLMMDLEDRNDPNVLSSIPIAFRQGNPIFLPEVARLETGTGVDKIDRRDRSEEVRITADLLPGYAAGTVQGDLDRWIAENELIPAGVRVKPLGQADVQAREGVYLIGALLLGFVLVYMLLASLYDNLLYPFIIQLAQPQAMVGALLALMITDKTFNIVGFIGLIVLVGLVGKNAILLVDYANTLRSRGKERGDALLESGRTRLRPIMMTSLALVLGVLPVALAIGRGSEFRETIGITIIGGITLSTLLTLLVIPCSYTIFDDMSRAFGRLLRRGRDSDDDGAPPGEPANMIEPEPRIPASV